MAIAEEDVFAHRQIHEDPNDQSGFDGTGSFANVERAVGSDLGQVSQGLNWVLGMRGSGSAPWNADAAYMGSSETTGNRRRAASHSRPRRKT